MNFFGLNKPLNVNNAGAFQPYLFKILLFNDYKLTLLILVPLYNVFTSQNLTGNLILLLICNRVMPFAGKQVKADGLCRINRVVYPNRYSNQRKTDKIGRASCRER